jgi:hypothetical protein
MITESREPSLKKEWAVDNFDTRINYSIQGFTIDISAHNIPNANFITKLRLIK